MKTAQKIITEKDAKALLALLIVLIAFGILLLFNSYQEQIFLSNSFYSFMTLTVIGMALLLGLLFLANRESVTKKKKTTR